MQITVFGIMGVIKWFFTHVIQNDLLEIKPIKYVSHDLKTNMGNQNHHCQCFC